YVETISSKQSDLDQYTAEGYKNALSEERRRYCFLVDRQCAVAKNNSSYHSKGKDLLAQKIPAWQQACADPTKLPDRALLLAQQMTSAGGTLGSSSHTHHSSKGNLLISDPIPGAKPLPVPPELAALMAQQRLMGPGGVDGGMPIMNGTAGAHGGAGGGGGEDYQHWMEGKMAQAQAQALQAAKASTQPQHHSQPHRQGSEVYSNTLPVRKNAPAKSNTTIGLERNGRTRVQAIFSHAAGDNSTLLSFSEGDVITLLVPEARDGWHYGENERNKMRGWFPFSYTRVIPETESDKLRVNNLHHGKSSSTGNLLEREDMAGVPTPDYGMSSRLLAQSAAMAHSRQQRPYSVAGPGFSQFRRGNSSEIDFNSVRRDRQTDRQTDTDSACCCCNRTDCLPGTSAIPHHQPSLPLTSPFPYSPPPSPPPSSPFHPTKGKTCLSSYPLPPSTPCTSTLRCSSQAKHWWNQNHKAEPTNPSLKDTILIHPC
ncbi:unnamed protein product, partial [Coregonus sp. 'balchen']